MSHQQVANDSQKVLLEEQYGILEKWIALDRRREFGSDTDPVSRRKPVTAIPKFPNEVVVNLDPRLMDEPIETNRIVLRDSFPLLIRDLCK